jgi:glycosyltransferase involved in cell wall biosynthesis
VNDGSTDKLKEILDSYAKKDYRIKALHNLGIVQSVTKGIQHFNRKYIVRMDSDDISLPERFKLQFDYMEAHPEIDALGTAFNFIDESGKSTGKYVVRPMDPLVIRFEMFYRCMLHNPTVIARSEFYRKFNENKEEEKYIADDYAFWMRMNFDHLYANLENRLLLYRLHSGQITSTGLKLQKETFISTAHLAIQKLVGKPIQKEVVKTVYLSKRYTSEKMKSYIMKYKKDVIVLLVGGIYLLRLLPNMLVKDIFKKKEFRQV